MENNKFLEGVMETVFFLIEEAQERIENAANEKHHEVIDVDDLINFLDGAYIRLQMALDCINTVNDANDTIERYEQEKKEVSDEQ